jgi:hypothetical protein
MWRRKEQEALVMGLTPWLAWSFVIGCAFLILGSLAFLVVRIAVWLTARLNS